ncbi:MAG: acetyltransferase [Acidobacteria bacterium]|nr:acetyltransferase [Acidobacteriota bacterium]
MESDAEQEITVRDCVSLDDFRQCVTLQQTVWGFADKDLIPARFFVVAHKIEGQVIGAFEPDGRMVGFCLAVPALRGRSVYLHSHMVAVLPGWRRRSLGRRLKLEQRRQALEKGIGLMEWTFDPLELQNAYFNLERLGAIARRYVPNQYGISSSPLHRGLPTDRLVAEWWLESPRVATLAGGETPSRSEVSRRIEVPAQVVEQGERDPAAVGQLQQELRRQFQEAFAEGLAAVGFEATSGTGKYLLGPWEEQGG